MRLKSAVPSLVSETSSPRTVRASWRRGGLLFGLLQGCLACSSQSSVADESQDSTSEQNDPDRGDAGDTTDELYALMSHVYSASGDRAVYVKPFRSLDDKLTLDDAREFPGIANISAASGRLLVSSGEAPTIMAFEIDEGLKWTQVDELSFANFPLYDNANFFAQYRVDDHHMYLPFDTVKRIVWDPTDFEIVQVMEDSVMEPTRGTLSLLEAGNRSGLKYVGSTIAPFFYHDEEWVQFGDTSPIAIYDPETHEETKVIEAPCAGLAIASQDEDGNTYFSPYDYSPLLALYQQGPEPCVVRITKEHELDTAFTTDFSEWTDGRFINSFRYIRDGWGLAAVFHHERTDFDFSAQEIDPEAYDAMWEEENWSVWRFDLKSGTAAPYDAIDIPSFGWNYSQVNGRSFLMVYSENTTKILELDSDGSAREHLEIDGDASWIKVR